MLWVYDHSLYNFNYFSVGIDFRRHNRRHILTSKVDARAVRVNDQEIKNVLNVMESSILLYISYVKSI